MLSMSILIILLGCHISHILMDRVNTATTFANLYNSNVKYYELNEYKINWFLSGGIKNKGTSDLTEAEKMKNALSNDNIYEYNWNYIIDDVSTNTAQNFIMANKMKTNNDFESIYVVTSDFHYERAKNIADLIDEDNMYNWILSPIEERDSRRWERIHMKNIENDVISAKRNLLVR
jgi:hypothetical protein